MTQAEKNRQRVKDYRKFLYDQGLCHRCKGNRDCDKQLCATCRESDRIEFCNKSAKL